MSTITFLEYQARSRRTARYPQGLSVLYPALGLCGEAGEVAEKIKKVFRDNDGVFEDEHRAEIAKEIGDVLWYCAQVASDLGIALPDAAEGNLEKLADRSERGVISGSGDNR